ncbi:hypothetical protein ACFX2J_034929 [Malus domestica]
MGGHAALSAATFDPRLCEPLLQPKQGGQGHGGKSTLEMVRCTNMGKARHGKAGILLWMRRPITSKSLDLVLVLVLSAYRMLKQSKGFQGNQI